MDWIDYKTEEISLVFEKTLQDIENTICPNVLISTDTFLTQQLKT